MTDLGQSGGQLDEEQADEAVDAAGRAGFAAKGVLYAIVAALAASVGLSPVFGVGGGEASQTGAISALADTSYGTVILGLLVFGLLGYGVLMGRWLYTAPQGHDGLRDVADRIGYAVRCVVHVGLAIYATAQLFGSGGGGGDGSQQLTRQALELPGGRLLVGIAALVALGVAIGQVVIAVKQSFLRLLESADIDIDVTQKLGWAGTIGHATRAVVFGTVGVLLAQAALASDASEAGGVDRALSEISRLTGGPVLLNIVALGLLCYAVFCFGVARWGSVQDAG